MGTSTVTIEVDRPGDEVFAYVTDPTRFVEWQQAVVDAAVDHHGAPAVGDRFRTVRRVGPMKRPFTSEVVEVHPPTAWRVRGVDGPIRATVDVAVRSLSAQRSSVTISITFEGRGIGRLIVPLAVERGVPTEMARDMAALKARLEST